MTHGSLEDNLREMEQTRERYWRRYPATSPTKLEWRALTVRHAFHVLPGERVLELGAGSGLWTEHLTTALKGGTMGTPPWALATPSNSSGTFPDGRRVVNLM